MRQKLPLAVSIAALVVALLGVTGPAVAHGVRHALFAHNADKVDGKHAVGAVASVNAREGKLVATSRATGRLPNNIIAKAPDANLLDGLNSTAFLGATAVAGGDLTGTYPSPAIADGAVTNLKLAPDVGLGFFTGRVTDLDQGSAGPVSGLSQAADTELEVFTLSPDREIRMSDLAATLTNPVSPEVVVIEVALHAYGADGTVFAELSCLMHVEESECTNAGPSEVVPPRSLLSLMAGVGVGLPPGTDVLFSWRAQAP